MAGAAADAVGFLGNADEDGIHVEEFERFVKLFGFGNGSSVVGFAGHDQCGRFDFGDKIGEGALHVIVGVVPRETREPIFCDEGDVGGKREAVPINNWIESRGGAEALGVFDGPAGENTAPAAAGNEEIVGINVALGDDGVDAAIQVIKIVAGISVMDEIGKVLAVAGAAARIDVENDVAAGSEHLFFEVETVAIVGEGATVNFKNQGIFLAWVEIRWVDDPSLDFAVVRG